MSKEQTVLDVTSRYGMNFPPLKFGSRTTALKMARLLRKQGAKVTVLRRKNNG